jgi:GNAT superfamily N-acetyltransferase
MPTTQAEPGIAVRVRAAQREDVDAIAALRLALIREYEGHPVYGQLHPNAGTRARQLCDEQLGSARDAFFIAEAEGDLVGILRCTESHASPLLLPERFGYLSSAYVRPAWRRHGVLRALLGEAERWCAERGLTQLRLHNVPDGSASAAWAALGFGLAEEVRVRPIGAS